MISFVSTGPGRYRAGCVRVDPRQPEDQPVRDPRRPGPLRGHQQPAEPDRPGRPPVDYVILILVLSSRNSSRYRLIKILHGI